MTLGKTSRGSKRTRSCKQQLDAIVGRIRVRKKPQCRGEPTRRTLRCTLLGSLAGLT
jgi:hypothetical protein